MGFFFVELVSAAPLKTAFYPAAVTMAVNLAINAAGKNKDADKYDFAYVHYGDRKFRTGLVTESMAMHIAEPFLEAGKAALEGGDARDIASAAGQGVLRGGGGLAGNLRPEIQAAAELLSNRQYMGGTKEIWKPEDRNIPGKVAPTRQLDKMLAFIVIKAFPAVNRFLDASYDNVDLATGTDAIERYEIANGEIKWPQRATHNMQEAQEERGKQLLTSVPQGSGKAN